MDQRDGNVTQVGNHSEEQQAAPIPHLLVPRVHPRTPRGHQWGHCTGGGQAATGRTRVLRGTNEPPPKAPKFSSFKWHELMSPMFMLMVW